MLLAVDHLAGAFVLDRTAQRTVEQAERLYRLAQVVTRRGEEGVIGLLCPLRGLACGNDLLLHAAALGYVPDDAGDEHTARRLDRAEADFHGEFAAILAAPQKVQARPHRPQLRLFAVTAAMALVMLTDSFGQKHLDFVTQQFGTAVAEHVLRLPIDDGYAATLVDDDHRVRGRLEHRTEIGFRLVGGVHLPDRAGHQQAGVGLHRRQRNLGAKTAAVLAQAVQVQAGQQRPRPRRRLVPLPMLLVLVTHFPGQQRFHRLAHQFLRRVTE